MRRRRRLGRLDRFAMVRSTELRHVGFEFTVESDERRWRALTTDSRRRPPAPHRAGVHSGKDKEIEVGRAHRLSDDDPVILIEVELGDPSEFVQRPVNSIVDDLELSRSADDSNDSPTTLGPEGTPGRVGEKALTSDRRATTVIQAVGCVSVAHVIAAAAIELARTYGPVEAHFGWSSEAPIAANLNFNFFGQGNVPWMVRDLIGKSGVTDDRAPRIVVT
jgi:hypothetical protein